MSKSWARRERIGLEREHGTAGSLASWVEGECSPGVGVWSGPAGSSASRVGQGRAGQRGFLKPPD